MSSVKRLNPREAFDALKTNGSSVLLDVRDPVEFSLVGHPVDAVNIPWRFAPDWRPNPEFLDRVRRLVPKPDTPVYLICRSGQRSLDAANALAGVGYTDLANIEEGFEGPLDDRKHRGTLGGWRHHELPWEQT